MKRILYQIVIAIVGIMLATTPAAADNFFSRMFGPRIKGSGDLQSETRDVSEFERIKLSGSFDVSVKVGQPQSLKVTFDDNLLDNVVTKVRGRTLRIYSEDSYSSHYDCRVEITVPKLEDVSLSGSGDIEIRDLDGGDFSVSVSGSGNIRADGKVDELEISVSGSGDIDARDLEAVDAYVTVSGSGDVDVFATGELSARVSGSGDIAYYGSPEHISQHVSGSGDIRKKR